MKFDDKVISAYIVSRDDKEVRVFVLQEGISKANYMILILR